MYLMLKHYDVDLFYFLNTRLLSIVAVTCLTFDNPMLTLVDRSDQYDYNTTMNVICDVGYKLSDHDVTNIDITCEVSTSDLTSGQWSVLPSELQCVRE